MLEKLKALSESIKSFVLYLGTPLLLFGGVIYMLLSKNRELKDQVAADHRDAEIKQLESDQAVAKQEADDAEASYDTLRSEYLKSHPDDSR